MEEDSFGEPDDPDDGMEPQPERAKREPTFRERIEALLKSGDVKKFNEFRQTHREWKPELCGIDLSGISLKGIDFSHADLQNAVFRCADLEGADFQHALLPYARLNDTKLKGVRFDYAQMTGVDLKGADVEGVSFYRTDLYDADLRGVKNLNGAKLAEAHIYGAKLTNQALVESTLEALRQSLQGVK